MARTIAENLQRLEEVRQNLIGAIRAKGGTVSSDAPLSNLPTTVATLPSGSIPPSQSGNIKKGGDLLASFAIFSDIHFEDEKEAARAVPASQLPSYHPTTDEDRGYWEGEHKIFPKIAELAPTFVAYLGDTIRTSGETTKAQYGPCQLDKFKYLKDTFIPNIPLFAIPGNHDIGNENGSWSSLPTEWENKVARSSTYNDFARTTFAPGSKTVYSFEYNGDLYIFFGAQFRAAFNYTQAEYDFIFNLLEENKNRGRIFVFSHWYDSTRDGWGWRDQQCVGNYSQNGWMESDASHATRGPFGRITEYKNVIWFCGHAHTPWASEQFRPNVKVHSNNCARLVGLPCAFQDGEFAIVNVYANEVEIQAWEKDSSRPQFQGRKYFIGDVGSEEDSGDGPFSVTWNLKNAKAAYQPDTLDKGDEFDITIEPSRVWQSVDNLKVTMNGVTQSVSYNSGVATCHIGSVTGKIVITAEAYGEEEWDKNEEHPDMVKFIYDVTSTSAVTPLTSFDSGAGAGAAKSQFTKVIIDGDEVDMDTLPTSGKGFGYQFSTTGKHVVYMSPASKSISTLAFYKNPNLWSVYSTPEACCAASEPGFTFAKYVKLDMGYKAGYNEIVNGNGYKSTTGSRLVALEFGEYIKGITWQDGHLGFNPLPVVYCKNPEFCVWTATSDGTISSEQISAKEITFHLPVGASSAILEEQFPNATIIKDI